MRFLKLGGLIAVVGMLLAAAVSYSWTFTPIGRLEYGAAIVAKFSEWNEGPGELTEEARQIANEMVRGRMPRSEALARVEDREIESDGVKILLRIYWPKAESKLPVYLNIHGGGRLRAPIRSLSLVYLTECLLSDGKKGL